MYLFNYIFSIFHTEMLLRADSILVTVVQAALTMKLFLPAFWVPVQSCWPFLITSFEFFALLVQQGLSLTTKMERKVFKKIT